jgi:hypothetical protein
MPNDQAAYVWPTANKQPVLASSDGEDDGGSPAGTGLQELTVTYLDENFAEQTEDVTLTGASEVTMTADNVRRINNIEAKTVGSTGYAVGNVYVKDATGGNIIGYVAAGDNSNQVGVYTVPAGKTLNVTDVKISGVHTAANKRAIVRIEKNVGDVFFTIFETALVDTPVQMALSSPIVLPEQTDVRVSGVSDGTATVHLFISGWTETN